MGLLNPAIEGYSRATQFFREIEDKKNLAMSLGNIGTVAEALADAALACSYWTQSLDVYLELKGRDTGRITEHVWDTPIEELRKAMHRVGCNVKGRDNLPPDRVDG